MDLDAQRARKQELEQQMLAMQQEIDEIRTSQKKPALMAIVDSMLDLDLTPKDVQAAYHQRTGKVPTTLRKAGVKYRHPTTGESWSGRGKAPRWLTNEEGRGRARSEFLVDAPE
jgi:DNA-binding protein H-NS